METAIKVAFASTDMKHIDQHFGAAESFAIYAINPDGAQLVEATQFGKLAMDGNEDKLDVKIKALAGCVAVYSQAVGASAVAKLKAANIQPVKVSAGAEIASLIEALQDELRQGPQRLFHLWLAKRLQHLQPVETVRRAPATHPPAQHLRPA